MDNVQQTLEFTDHKAASFVYGRQDENLRTIERLLDVQIAARGGRVTVEGDAEPVQLAANALLQMFELVQEGFPLFPRDVTRAVEILRHQSQTQLKDIFLDTVFVSSRNKVITPRGLAQKRYIDSIRRDDIVFGVGPAGTGKTYLAMAMALAALTSKQVQRVILTRPAVEAGEKLGFLPGDLQDKVNPYLRPLYDALYDMLDGERAQLLMEKNIIEVAPLAFMRGRTLNGAFVILDEAQNTTKAQMKMFLTRLGFDSKMVITGDITQIDLERKSRSGLLEAIRILNGVPGISFSRFSQVDVVRHGLVTRIIQAYDTHDQAHERRERGQGGGDGEG
ncbi:MAG: phosphate starvation-inducible protein PhoH [Myxococcales bacterium]|nr:phosphate starvation-inducible protein PhoH [Myxococcales bacterium]